MSGSLHSWMVRASVMRGLTGQWGEGHGGAVPGSLVVWPALCEAEEDSWMAKCVELEGGITVAQPGALMVRVGVTRSFEQQHEQGWIQHRVSGGYCTWAKALPISLQGWREHTP